MDNIDPLVKKLRARLRAAEPDSRGYKSVNDSTNALGLYQFVPKYHWSKIKSMAITSGYGSPDEITHDFFLNNPDLQEEYFGQYVKDEIAPRLEKLAPYNTRNLDLDEIAQLIHLRPESVKRYLEGGEFYLSNPEQNMTIPAYLAKGDRGLEAKGWGHLKPSELMSEEEISQNVNEYITKSNDLKMGLDNGKYSDGAFRREMRKLQKDYSSKGLTSDINRILSTEEADKRKVYNSKREEARELLGILSSKEKGSKDGWFQTGNSFTKQYDKDKNRLTVKGTRIAIDELAKKYDLRKNTKTVDKGKYKEHHKLNEITFDLKGNGPNAKTLLSTLNEFTDKPISFEDLQNSPGLGQQYSQKHIRNDFKLDKNYSEKPFNFINPDIVDTQNVKSYDTGKGVTPKTTETKIEQEKVDTSKTNAPDDLVTAGDLTEFMSEAEAPLQAEYDPNNFKKEIPFGAAVQGFLGAMGMAQADNEIPKRDEKLSAGMESYIRELQEITRVGLPPAVEAKAKNDLAEAYQLGLENIVRASGGNRNIVLGNQSQLDLAKMDASQNIRIADFEAKVKASNKYGEAMRYVNDFNSRRDIANKQLEQTLALQDREAGGQLAAIGFSNMISSIQDQKERAPGTPYHMLMSQMAMDSFGVIPGMKDDGTGKPGTVSGMEAQKAKFNEYNTSVKGYKANVAGFNQEQLNEMQKFSETTEDPNELFRFSEELNQKQTANTVEESNPNIPSLGFKPF